jgi:hypothetical protein
MATTQRILSDPLCVDAANEERRYRCPNGHANWEPRPRHVCCRDCRRSSYPQAVHALLWDAKAQQWLQCRYVAFE